MLLKNENYSSSLRDRVNFSSFLKNGLSIDKRLIVTALTFSSITSLFYLALMLFFTKGNLYFGGDVPGFYNTYDFTLNPTLSNFFYIVGLILGGLNFYVGDYISLFLIMEFILFFLYLIANLFLSQMIQDQVSINVASFLVLIFYIVGPIAIDGSRYTFAGNIIDPNNMFTLVFLLGLFSIHKIKSSSISDYLYPILLIAIGFSLSLPTFPNNIRIAVVQYFIVIFVLLVFPIFNLWHQNNKSIRFYLTLTGIISLVIVVTSTYSFLPIFLHFGSFVSTATSGATANSYIGFYTGTFNSLPFSSRLFGTWLFPNTAYFSLYSKVGIIYILSFGWPLLALFPLLLIRKWNAQIIIPSMLLLAIMMFWYKGSNPPLGFIWWDVNSIFPDKYQFIPPSEFGFYIFIIYYTFVAFSVVSIANLISKNFKISLPKNILKYFTIFAILFLLAYSMQPVFTGQVETTPYNSSTNTTFKVPHAYSQARNFLKSHGDVVLIFPQTSTYFGTTWNYSGTAAFYQVYFSPEIVVNEYYYGGDYINKTNLELYYNITHPIEEIKNVTSLNPSWASQVLNDNVSYIMYDQYITMSQTQINETDHFINYLTTNNLIQEAAAFNQIILYKTNFQSINHILQKHQVS